MSYKKNTLKSVKMRMCVTFLKIKINERMEATFDPITCLILASMKATTILANIKITIKVNKGIKQLQPYNISYKCC
jgi:hypothetical protein